MRKRKGMDWLPLWSDKWLLGSTRFELKPDERSVWMDFLVLGSKDDGWIRANSEMGYPHEYLCNALQIPMELLQRSIDKFIKYGKLKIHEKGIYYVINWKEYQLSDRQRRRVEKKVENN